MSLSFMNTKTLILKDPATLPNIEFTRGVDPITVTSDRLKELSVVAKELFDKVTVPFHGKLLVTDVEFWNETVKNLILEYGPYMFQQIYQVSYHMALAEMVTAAHWIPKLPEDMLDFKHPLTEEDTPFPDVDIVSAYPKEFQAIPHTSEENQIGVVKELQELLKYRPTPDQIHEHSHRLHRLVIMYGEDFVYRMLANLTVGDVESNLVSREEIEKHLVYAIPPKPDDWLVRLRELRVTPHSVVTDFHIGHAPMLIQQPRRRQEEHDQNFNNGSRKKVITGKAGNRYPIPKRRGVK